MRISIRKIDCSLTNKCPKASHELMDLKFYCHCYYFLSFSISQTLRFTDSPGNLVKRADSDSVGRGEAGGCAPLTSFQSMLKLLIKEPHSEMCLWVF